MVAPSAALCWSCGAPLVAWLMPGLTVLRCVACDAGSTLPPPIVDAPVRCLACRKLIAARAARPWAFRCPRCNTNNTSAA